MKSAASEPLPAPTYTRTTHKGRDYVAVGTWTQAEMLAAIKRIGK